MALSIPTRASRYKVQAADWNEIVNGVNGESVALDTVETRTTDTTTNGGHGNVRLSDRLGTGVGTGSNVTTGSATSQLTDLRTRVTTVESAVGTAIKGVQYRLTGGTLPLVGQNVRIIWNTTDISNAAITYNGSNGLFTAVSTGWYSGVASVRINANGELYLWWAGSTATGDTEDKTSTQTTISLSCPFRAYWNAGQTFGVYGWVNGGISATCRYVVETAGDAIPCVKIRYEGL